MYIRSRRRRRDAEAQELDLRYLARVDPIDEDAEAAGPAPASGASALPDAEWHRALGYVRAERDLEALAYCSRRLMRLVSPLVKCPACQEGWRKCQLSCGHKLCRRCFSRDSKCPLCWCPHAATSYTSQHGWSDPRSSEPDLRSVGPSSLLGDGQHSGTTDTIPLGGTAAEYFPDPDGVHNVRWLSRKPAGHSADRPFNSPAVSRAEEQLAEAWQKRERKRAFTRVWRIHKKIDESFCHKATVWFIPVWDIDIGPEDRNEATLLDLSCGRMRRSAYEESEAAAVMAICISDLERQERRR